MTTPARLERSLPAILGELAAGPMPDYIDDVLVATAQRRQRPAWTFPERWLPMTDITDRQAFAPTGPWRLLAVTLVVLALVAGATIVYIGSQRSRVPAPFGSASNGLIAFNSSGDTWILDPTTGERRPIVADDVVDFGAEFSRDGTRLAILSLAPGGGNRIRITSADGAAPPIWLAPDPFAVLHAWSWSPDGRSMATTHEIDGAQVLSIVPTDGGPIRTLDLGGLVPAGADWRPPDGREILFRGERDGQVGLYTVGPDGSGLRLVHGPEPAVGPLAGPDPNLTNLGGATWSPDGTRIAYMVVRAVPGGDPVVRVHVVRSDGSGDRELMAPEGVSETWPVWSPDGRRLVTGRFGGGETWSAVVDLDGGALDLDRSDAVAGWSPDGRLLLLSGSGGTVRVDPDTGAQVGEAWTGLDWPVWQRLP